MEHFQAMVTYKIVLIILSTIYSVYLIYLMRKLKLHIFQMSWWLITVITLLIFGVYPKLIDKIGFLLKIKYPPIFLVILAILFLLIKLIFLDKYITENEIRIKDLSRKIAILEKNIEDLDKKIKN